MKKSFVALAALAALGSGSAFAQKAGDWVVGGGWLHMAPQDSSEPLTVTSPVHRVVPDSGASVTDSDTLGLTATYFIDGNWAVEGVVGIPPKFELNGEGSLARVGELGTARQWSPTLLGKYYFGSGQDAFRPYVGLGATYVWYSDVQLSQGLQNTLGGLASQIAQRPLATVTTAKLDSKLAPVVNIGAAYQFDAHWGVSFSVSYIPLKTTAKLTTTTTTGVPVATSEAKLKLNPIVPFLAVTYRF
ncbi:OmpW family outer membrane protein [Variovorax sp. J22R133]|uniref:OmpW/AlkL family protein n=1 Tax=Variovorax brevis TaxID=3053503 RepID=UPI0025769241|nr:OmpW family outer membrane protein [Variovorax sp. J22R133]MDM0115112.1 OmpW family outer membrane protein [Variovorax sp. J22R133]